MQRTTQIGPRRPVGFSLVELLVVISIIIALIAIAIPTIGNILDTGRRAATLATLEKADSLLKDQIAAFNRKMDETNEVAQKARENFFQMNFTPRAAEIAARKALFQTYFPQNADEATDTDKYQHIRPGSVYSTWVPGNNEYDSAELLYLTLTRGRFSGAGSGEPVEFSGSELDDADDDNFMELVDAWGNPLRFYRWPTRLLRSDALNRDPDDPRGEILNTVTSSQDPDAAAAEFEKLFHAVDRYHTPLIVSAGSDGEFGLFAPSDITNFGHLAAPQSQDPDVSLSNPGDTPLADNLTNLTGGLSN